MLLDPLVRAVQGAPDSETGKSTESKRTRRKDSLGMVVSFLIAAAIMAALVEMIYAVLSTPPPPSPASSSVKTVRVAFIGNSYTYFNDLPGTIAALLAASSASLPISARITLKFDQFTPGGRSLSYAAANASLVSLLAPSQRWDLVVLQDLSTAPGRHPSRNESIAALNDIIAPLIVAANVKRVVLYMTPAHRNGSVVSDFSDDFPDFPTMTAKTREGYLAYASLLQRHGLLVSVCPADAAFSEVHNADPESQDDSSQPRQEPLFSRLFYPDGFHPSRLGTYLIAATFVQLLLSDSFDMRDLHQGPTASPFEWSERARAFAETLPARFGEGFVPEDVREADGRRLREPAWRAVHQTHESSTTSLP